MDNNTNDAEYIVWYIEKNQFDTIREAHEWVYSGAYNEIGYLYDGYKCKDEKLAYALLFELVRANTIHGRRFDVHSDVEYVDETLFYKVWVSKKERNS